MFLDEATFRVRAGSGGDGAVSFRREKYAPRGGPDGGDGGRGGDVVLLADPGRSTLLDVARKSIYSAEDGARGEGGNRSGRQGQDLVIEVPTGTVVREVLKDKPPEEGPILGELLEAGARLIAARGGKGGRGNKSFATPIRQTPRHAEEGGKGEEKLLYLELKILADVGLIGLPNAGKSTFLARISAATPKIAAYPFTTRYPNLGIAELSDFRRLVIADIPGLIEGAHRGLGLGIEFLRHIERTRILVHLVSVEAALEGSSVTEKTGLGAPGGAIHLRTDLLERNYRMIEGELGHYSPVLEGKPRAVVLSKIDLISHEASEGLAERFSRSIGKPVRAVSGATGAGVSALLSELFEEVRAERSRAVPENPQLPAP